MHKITIAPIPLDDLKEYFSNKEIKFHINYDDSTLKGEKLLTYLSNLDVPCDVFFKNTSKEEKFDIVKSYLNTRMLVNIKSLEVTALLIVLASKGIDNTSYYNNNLLTIEEINEFIEFNKEIVEKWTIALASGSVYNLYTIKDDKIKDLTNDFDKVDDAEYCGINYVKLYNYLSVFELFPKVKPKDKKFLVKQFTEPMFKGSSMYDFWYVKNNPMAILTYGIASGSLDNDKYFKLKRENIENVSTI